MAGGPGGRVHVFQEAGYPRRAAAWIAERMRRAAAYRGRFALALAGGTVAESVYEVLARTRGLPWRKAELFVGDGRAGVPDRGGRPPRDAAQALLDRIPVPPERVHPMPEPEEDGDGEAAARRYATQLPDRLDLAIVELGPDGRIGCLTPGTAALDSDRRVVAPAPGDAGSGPRLGPAALKSARTLAVLARGDGVAGAVETALETEGSPVDCPARLARDGHWLLDPAAAAGLQRPSG